MFREIDAFLLSLVNPQANECIASSSLRRGSFSGHVNSRRAREEEPSRKKAPCYEREKESKKEKGEEKKKRNSERRI